ncbi:MAG: glycosyltransferase family 87 protein [Chloroflexota bacterium]
MQITKHTFAINPDNMRERLLKPPARAEFVVLSAVSVLAACFAYLITQGMDLAVDYGVFLEAVEGDYTGFFYAPWSLPIFTVLSWLPLPISYLIWNMINILLLWIAVRVFGGNLPITMIGYQMIYCLFYGQIVGLLAGVIALFWVALLHRRFVIAGLLLTIAAIKPQLGVPMAVALLLLTDMTWWHRFKVVVISLVPAILSLLLYPNFIVDVYQAYLETPPNTFGSISLWRYIGAGALLLWIPTLTLPMSFGRRLVAILATTALSSPYFQQTDLLLLYAMPIGWVGLLGNVGFLMGRFGWWALRLPIIVPLIVYIWVLVTPIRQQIQGWRKIPQSSKAL